MAIYKIGVVGAGNVTTMHLDGLKAHPERVEVVAICDLNAEALHKRADQYQIGQRFEKLDDFIENSGVDAAVVCTPSPVRKQVLFPLLEAGIPVFVEKPLAETIEEATEIAQKSRQLGVPVSIDQNFRTFFTFDTVKRLIRENAIGKVAQVVLNDMYYRQDKGWRLDRSRHAMSVMGIHWYDGFRWILGCEARSILCQTYSSAAVECAGDTDAAVQIVFENGVPVTYVQSFSSAYKKVELIVVGEDGTLVSDYRTVHLYRKGTAEPVQSWNESFSKPESAFDGLNQLLMAKEQGTEAPNNVHDNLRTIALLEAAYRSAEQGGRIELKGGLLA